MTIRKRIGQIPWVVLLIVIALIFMIPLIFMVSMSLRTNNTIGMPQLFVADVTFKNYMNVLNQKKGGRRKSAALFFVCIKFILPSVFLKMLRRIGTACFPFLWDFFPLKI